MVYLALIKYSTPKYIPFCGCCSHYSNNLTCSFTDSQCQNGLNCKSFPDHCPRYVITPDFEISIKFCTSSTW